MHNAMPSFIPQWLLKKRSECFEVWFYFLMSNTCHSVGFWHCLKTLILQPSVLCIVYEHVVDLTAGEESPTDGTAYIFGRDIGSNPKAARRHVCCDFLFLDWMLVFVKVILIDLSNSS